MEFIAFSRWRVQRRMCGVGKEVENPPEGGRGGWVLKEVVGYGEDILFEVVDV